MGLELLSLLVLLAAPGGEVETLQALEAEWFERGPECADCASGGFDHLLPTEWTTRGLDRAPRRAVGAPLRLDAFEVQVVVNAAVRDFLDFFQGRGRFIYAKWWARMHRYRHLMLPILERHGVPPELIFVCMIESGFRPDAVSRAAAVGPWQFIARTGQHYGLRQDAWVDERRDPLKSTEAAAKHLSDLHERFGSWLLAMAAYNAGVGHVDSAIRRTNTNDFWRLSEVGTLTDEAMRYVPKALAAMIIGQAPARYGFGAVKPEPPMRFVTVAVPGKLDLRKLARRAGVPAATLEELNPELRRAFTPPDGIEYPLRVPPDAEAKVVAAVDALGKRPPDVYTEHRVRFGERLIDIARRYGTSRRTLRQLNDLSPGDEVEAGADLVVPSQDAGDPPDRLLVVTDPGLAFVVEGRREVFFPVRQATDLSEVARFFGVSPGHIGMWNGVDPAAPAQRGMVLRLYVPDDFDLSSAVLADPEDVVQVDAGTEAHRNALEHAKEDRPPTIKRVKHTIRRGESLWKLGRRYGVTVKELRAENGLARGQGLSVGQVVVVPKRVTPRPKGKAARRKAKKGARGRRNYKVRRGDSLWKIARRHDVSLKALRRANGFGKRPKLQPGQVLVIP